MAGQYRRTNTMYLLDELSSIRKDLWEGWTKNDGILSFAVLYHIVGKVEKIQAVIVISWKKEKQRNKGLNLEFRSLLAYLH